MRHSSGSGESEMSSARAISTCRRFPPESYSLRKRVVAAPNVRKTGTPGRSRAASNSGPAAVRIATSQPSFRTVWAAKVTVPPSTSPSGRRSQVTWPTASSRGTVAS